MASEDRLQKHFPYHTVIQYMISPLRDKLKNVNAFHVEDLRESLESITAMSQLVLSLSQFPVEPQSQKEHQDVLLCIVKDVCFPMLYSLHLLPESDKQNSEKGRAVALIKGLILLCTDSMETKDLAVVVTQILILLKEADSVNNSLLTPLKIDDYHGMEPLNLHLSLGVFNSVLNHQNLFATYLSEIGQLNLKKEELLSHLFITVIHAADSDSTFSKAFTALSKLLSYFPKELREKCEMEVWQSYTQPLKMTANGNVDKDSLWRSLFVFYCLKNFFFPVCKTEKEVFSMRVSNNTFWSIVQAGLVSPEPSHRKLGMYLLKRLWDTCDQNGCSVNVSEKIESPMFWWSPKDADTLSRTWEMFMLLIEVLEEKQVHVVKPILPRMQKLISASSSTTNGGLPILHSSWLITIITRCFQHDSHFMSRWGALTLLTLDFQQVPLVQDGQLKFLSHDLLTHLQENKLYSRYEGTELGKCSPIGDALKSFFANLFNVLTKEQQVEYLRNLLQIVWKNNWGSIPLVFVFQGLSHIPPSPVLNSDLMQLVRQILQVCLISHEILTRGAIQCFICQTLMNLVDLESVNLKEFFATLTPLVRDESLQRGTSLWKSLVEWLSVTAVQAKWDDKQVFAEAVDFLKDSVEGNNTSVISDGYRVTSLARMLVLFADVTAQASLQEKKDVIKTLSKSPLGLTLAEISNSLTDIGSRAYVNIAKVDKCLSLLHALAKEAGTLQNDPVDQLLKKYLAMHFKDVSCFIKNRISQDLTKASDLEETRFYTDILLTLGMSSEHIHRELQDLVAFISRAFTVAISAQPNDENLEQFDILSTSAMGLLATVFQILANQSPQSDVPSLIKSFTKMTPIDNVPLPFSRKSSRKDVTSKAQVGYVVSHFISSKWLCRRYIFEHLSMEGKEALSDKIDAVSILNDAMDNMAIGSGNSDIAIFQALEFIITEVISKAEVDFPKLLEMSWVKVMEEKKNQLFWKKLTALIPAALHKSVLEQDKGSVVGMAVDQLLDKLCTVGAEKSGVLYLVFEHLYQHILKRDPERKIATRLIPLLVDGCYTGTLHKKTERLWLDVCAYIESLGDACAVNQIRSSVSRNDLFTRVIILNWLSQLQPHRPIDHQFVMAYLQALRSRYLDLASQTTYKQFSNSLSHRQKHRMVLVFPLLADFIKEDVCGDYLSMLWNALELECHPSVRQNLEWMVMLLLIRFPDQVSRFWDVLKLYDNKRSVCVCSLFIIMSHIGTKLPGNMQVDYYSKAFSAVLPWTMAHHYNTRIFAQTTIVKLWEQCRSLQPDNMTTQFSLVQSCVHFMFNNGNASATVTKLKDNFMFSGFDFVRDISMETIFNTLPRLACIADDEWILPRQFVQWDDTWQKEGHHLLPLKNVSDQLALCKAGPWRMKAQAENEDDITESAYGDVQKKIMPWRQMSPSQETEAELASQRQKRSEDGLILVTSLIDKIPNLGGLCRTSEIFGVSEFVIGNLIHTEDKMFQNLSVSAQKWISITEVLRPRLSEFLEEKRMQGYTLVGVEQTANSVCLQEYQFPKKTLLLLGNEKEGIPVDIIQSLDVCVEIPQLGVIRSLNVHVCGALIVWEYTRQHMNKTNSTGSCSQVTAVEK